MDLALGRPVWRIENRTTAKRVVHGQLGHFLGAYTENAQGIDVAFVYGPFGEILAQSGAEADYTERFNGKEQDALTSLSYYGARYFDPLSLTWTQADPLYRFAPDAAWDQPRRANLYTFNLQNPLKYVDPDGKNPNIHPVAMGCAMTGSTCVEETKAHNEEMADVGMAISQASFDYTIGGEILRTFRDEGVSAGIGQILLTVTPGGKGKGAGGKPQTPASANRVASAAGKPRIVTVSKSKHPQSAAHIKAAQKNGKPATLTIDRAGAKARRAEAMKGKETQPGKDRDEYPPAMFEEGGQGASVEPVNPGDNRGSGACIGNQCRDLSDGSQVTIEVVD